jgi:glutathione S-transferase
MSLILYFHPLASYCHKVLLALYENDTPFEGRFVDPGNEASRAEFLAVAPLGKMPVLRDRDSTVAETSIIIEYLDRHYPGATPLIPRHADLALQARLWDRFFDLYVSTPMQKIVGDRIRPAGHRDPFGVDEAKAALQTAYGMIDRQMAERSFAIGDAFSIADCSAAPALFYAEALLPFSRTHKHAAAYFDRLAQRPSFQRTLEGARPYFDLFPFRDGIPKRFL